MRSTLTAISNCGKSLAPLMVATTIAVFSSDSFAYADPSPFDPPSAQPKAESRPEPREAGLPKLSTAKEYYLRALKAEEAKEHQAAIRDYNEAIRMNPKYGEAYGNRGTSKFNSSDYVGALEDFTTSLQYFPNNKALLDLKARTENALREQNTAHAENNNEAAGNEAARLQAARQQLLQNAVLGGDMSDPATIIMMNARKRGLVP